MKKVFSIILAVMAICLAGSSLWAVPITEDVVTQFYWYGSSDNVVTSPTLSAGNYVTYSHNILDNGFEIGDEINSGSIALYINDLDGGHEDDHGSIIWWSWDYREYVQLTTDGISRSFEIDNGSTTTLGVDALSRLEEDGVLSVTLRATSGSFRLYSSVLNADYTDLTPEDIGGDDPPATDPVPEPATLMLLGSGLLGLAGLRKKNRQ